MSFAATVLQRAILLHNSKSLRTVYVAWSVDLWRGLGWLCSPPVVFNVIEVSFGIAAGAFYFSTAFYSWLKLQNYSLAFG